MGKAVVLGFSTMPFYRLKTWVTIRPMKRTRIAAIVIIVLTVVLAVWAISRRPTSVPVPILMYHSIEPQPRDSLAVATDQFEKQLGQLKELGYQTVLPQQLIEYGKGRGTLPPKPFIISMDDGYLTAQSDAEPILRKFGYQAVVYLITGMVADSPETRRSYEGRALLTWPEVKTLSAAGVLSFGGHTRHHLRLTEAPDPQAEILGCMEDLRSKGSLAPDSFAYPYGATGSKLARLVSKAGFSSAVTTDEGVAWSGSSKRLMLPRVWVTSTSAFPLGQITKFGQERISPWWQIDWGRILYLLLIGAALCCAVYGVVCKTFAENLVQRVEQLSSTNLFLALLIGAPALTLLIFELLKHYNFGTAALDLRLHEEIVRNTWQGKPMFSDILGRSFVGVHASFIFPVFSLLYPIWPCAEWLLILQGILVGAAGLFIWKLARLKGLAPILSAALVLSFFFYRGLVESYFTGFHQEIAAIFFLLGFFWAQEARKPIVAALFCVLALLCREDVALPLAIYGGCCALERRQRAWGVALFSVSFLWAATSILIIIPAFAPAGAMDSLDRWSALGNTVPQIAFGILTHPLLVLKGWVSSGVFHLFAALLFLPLLDPKTILPLFLPLSICALSSYSVQRNFEGAYAALYIAYLFAGTIRVLSWDIFAKLRDDRRVLLSVAALLLALNLRLLPWPHALPGGGEARRAVGQLNSQIVGKKVLAQASILPQLGWPKETAILSAKPPAPYDHYDYILLSDELEPFPLQTAQIRELSYSLSRSRQWRREVRGLLEVFVSTNQALPQNDER